MAVLQVTSGVRAVFIVIPSADSDSAIAASLQYLVKRLFNE